MMKWPFRALVTSAPTTWTLLRTIWPAERSGTDQYTPIRRNRCKLDTPQSLKTWYAARSIDMEHWVGLSEKFTFVKIEKYRMRGCPISAVLKLLQDKIDKFHLNFKKNLFPTNTVTLKVPYKGQKSIFSNIVVLHIKRSALNHDDQAKLIFYLHMWPLRSLCQQVKGSSDLLKSFLGLASTIAHI